MTFYKTYTIDNNSPSDRYHWQSQPEILSRIKTITYGLVLFQSRTGTGKTRLPLINLENDAKIYTKTIFYVPYMERNLVCQHVKEFRNYFETKSIKYTGQYSEGGYVFSVDLDIIKEYKISIKPFVLNRYSGYDELKDTKNCCIYMDEAHSFATSLGLHHAGSKYSHNTTNIQSIYNANYKDSGHHFSIIPTVCVNNKLVFMSATLDDIICNDILPYINTINIINIIINHSSKCLPNICIEFSQFMNIYLELAIKNKNKILIYASSGKEIQKILTLVKKYTDNTYTFTDRQKDTAIFSNYRAKQAQVCIFINKGTVGLDLPYIDNIFIFRKLSDKGSSSRDKEECVEFISNLAAQIIGRLRNDGIVYWQSNYWKITNYYDITKKQFCLNSQNQREKTYYMKLINRKKLNSSFESYHIRLAIFKWIWDEHFYYSRENRNTKTGGFIDRFGNYYFLTECEKIKKIMKNHKLHHHLEDYWELESKMITSYKELYVSINDNDDIFKDKHKYKENKTNQRTTGGGIKKSNISESEIQKGIKYADEAIRKFDPNGKSLLLKNKKRNDCKIVWMHAKNKSQLTENQRTKSKFAIPIWNTILKGLNQDEGNTNTYLWYDDETDSIRINYDTILKRLKDEDNGDTLRDKEEINAMLKEYSRLHRM